MQVVGVNIEKIDDECLRELEGVNLIAPIVGKNN